ncbi:melanization protease 1 isoform X2 [Neodiprion lecontei]|uniref:CLIP domain-containing serine protease n=1 Tax=Neodiprion lecontei TaxID=441921 RepID=A0A6J0B6A5_NEOLC|nr:melanization protease 1 isoform X2 [Neodiprion lecontei]
MLFYLGIIFLAISESNGQRFFPPEESCRSVSGTAGNCVNINECGQLLELLKQPRPLPTSTLDILSKSQCGFDGRMPKVCCPRNTQPAPTATNAPDMTTDVSTGVPQPPDVTHHPNLRLLDHQRCGPITESKIFGGNKTSVFEFPWMALIGYDVGKRDPEFRCGGSLISKRYVLTAAHCVTGLSSSLRLVGVRIGEHDLSKERDCNYEEGVEIACAARYQDFLVEKSYAHSGYNREKLHNDIALIRINGDADFQPDSVRPICLPIGNAATIQRQKLIVTGWGTTESGYRSQDLLKVKLPVMPNPKCASFYNNLSNPLDISYKQLCAGGSNQMDSCSGDSGGPAQFPGLYFNGQPRYIQFGIVSFGPRQCGIEGFPGVYTRVPYYMDWILNTMTE